MVVALREGALELMEPRAARASDLQTAAGWLGLDGVPDSWRRDLELGASLSLDEDGGVAGLAVLRPWGRVLTLPAVVVAPEQRARGLGRRLLDAAREQALRLDARTVGLEAEAGDLDSLAALLRRGFKAGPPVFELELPLPDPAAEEGDGDAAEPPPEPSVEQVQALASSLEAGFVPGEWMASALRGGARLSGVPSERGDLAACALTEPRSEAEGGALDCRLMLLGESEPFACLEALLASLAGQGARSLRLCAPARQADALRALLRAGGRIVGQRLRLSLAGFPERCDLRRAVLASWR